MTSLKRHLKDLSKAFFRRLFVLGQHAGVDILPRHFYSEIPDLRVLRHSDHWKKPFSMTGVAGADLDRQLDFARSCCPPELVERLKSGGIHEAACRRCGEVGYGAVEADFLYCFLRTNRPRHIVQVGCGVSTAVCMMAGEDAGDRPEITCVEPYPSRFLRDAQRDGAIRLIPEKVETAELEIGTMLAAGDLFFVDSTHTLGPAGEVTRIILEMLPQLPDGCWIHFHDILFPYDYPRYLMSTEMFFAHESPLLHAFLAYNHQFRLMASLAMLHYERSAELRELMPYYSPAGHDHGLQTSPGHRPSSAFIRVGPHGGG